MHFLLRHLDAAKTRAVALNLLVRLLTGMPWPWLVPGQHLHNGQPGQQQQQGYTPSWQQQGYLPPPHFAAPWSQHHFRAQLHGQAPHFSQPHDAFATNPPHPPRVYHPPVVPHSSTHGAGRRRRTPEEERNRSQGRAQAYFDRDTEAKRKVSTCRLCFCTHTACSAPPLCQARSPSKCAQCVVALSCW